MAKAEVEALALKMQEGGHKLRNAGASRKGKQLNSLLQPLCRELLTSRTVRKLIFVLF